MIQLFKRCERNPIITTSDLGWPASSVYNPGAVDFEGDVLLLLRVEDRRGFSSIHVARSKDGIGDWRISEEPLLQHGLEDFKYESFGCEDPRITWMEDDGEYYVCYVAYSESGPAVGLAKTKDFYYLERIGLVLGPDNKDTAMFPRKINGLYHVLHRQASGDGDHIWTASSPDLVNWGNPHSVIPLRSGPWWDGVKVGAGPPAIETDDGWLLIYHGVKSFGGKLVYRAGLALLDLDRPQRVLARTSGWVFGPQAPYETGGILPNVVFPTGALVRGDEIWMYYGAADTCVCLATAKLQDLLDVLQDERNHS